MIAIKLIDNVEVFEILDGHIYIGNSKEILNYNENFNTINKVDIGVFHMRKFCNNILIQPKEEEKRESIFIVNKDNKLLENEILLKSFIDKDNIYILGSNRNICKYDNDLNKVEEYNNLGKFPSLFINNYYVKILSNTIFCYKLKNNEILWQHSFSELLEAEQGDDFIFQNGNIVVHNGKIYFSLFENNRHLNTVTVCIDVETGKIEKKYKGFAGNLTLFSNKIAIAGDKVVEILDLETQTVLKKDYSKYLETDNLSISWNSFKISEDEMFYFIASDYRQGSYIGIIDLKTDELIWLHALNPDKEIYDIGALDFKVSENRMYVHCSDKSLYIFEKE